MKGQNSRDAEIGRFLSEDPVFNTNLYPFAGNNPISRIDADGEFWETVVKMVVYAYIEFRLQYGENNGNISQVNWKKVGREGLSPLSGPLLSEGGDIIGFEGAGDSPYLEYAGYAYKAYQVQERIRDSEHRIAISHYHPELMIILPVVAINEIFIEEIVRNGINGIEDGFRVTGKHIEDGFRAIGKRVEKWGKKLGRSLKRFGKSVKRRVRKWKKKLGW